MNKKKLIDGAKQMVEINRARSENQNFMGFIIIISILFSLTPFLMNSQRTDFFIISLSIIMIASIIFAYVVWYLLKKLDFQS